MQATGRPEGPEPVEERTYVVDLRDRGRPRYTGAYILTGPEPTVVETGGSISAPYLLAGLEALGVEPAQVRHVFVTHIHLDHAGGAGNLLRLMPEAKLYVHPRGARHLIDPSRLVAGAQVAWNGRAEELFGPVVPAPAERVVALRDGEVVALGGGRRLTAVDTPGHAPHHHAYYDSLTGGLFCGDVVGMVHPGLSARFGTFLTPVTAPTDVDPDAYVQSLLRLARLDVRTLFFTHFGAAGPGNALLERALGQIQIWTAAARSAWEDAGTVEAVVEALAELAIRQVDRRALAPDEVAAIRRELVDFSVQSSADGLIHRFRREAAGQVPR